MATKLEGLQWVLTIANTIKDIAEALGKAHSSLPPDIQQKIPGFLGLSLEDERIFNGLVPQVGTGDVDKGIARQALLMEFLREKCKDYERNRFINIVAGMEVVPEKPGESEVRWDNKTGNKLYEKTKDKVAGIDCRIKFLENFTETIKTQFNGNLDDAYKYCVGGRMIISNPIHQRALDKFSESIEQFKKIVLAPFGANSVEELMKKFGQKISEGSADFEKTTQAFEDGARARYEAAKARRRS